MSAHDVSQVLHQLQTVEKNMITILMEAAIKLTSLTESNIFFLVESGAQRRFAGSSTLCQRFLNVGLRSTETDVRLECDVNRFEVVECPPGVPDPPPNGPPKPKGKTRKRKSKSAENVKEKARKVLHSDFLTGIDENHDSTQSGEVFIEDIRSMDDSQGDGVLGDVGVNGDLHHQQQHCPDFPASIEDTVVWKSQESRLEETDFDPQFYGFPEATGGENGVDGDGGGGGDLSLVLSSEMDEGFQAKITALLSLEPTNCFVPTSEEQKLFHSIMYDLARHMANAADVVQNGPNSPHHRLLFKKYLEEFLNTYLADFLARVPPDFRVEKKGRMFTPMAIIRKSCNDSFRALLRRKFRQACLASNTPIPFQFH